MAIGEEKIKPMSFRKLMQLKQIQPDTYQSVSPAWSLATSSEVTSGAFGGHVYAQSAWAASKTVARGFVVHNVTGHFLLPGNTKIPFIYHVKRTRDGGSYALRHVEVYQNSKDGGSGRVPCFVSTISFKRDEQRGKALDYGHQEVSGDHFRRIYREVLKGKEPEDHPRAPSYDTDSWEENWTEQLGEQAEWFPGVEVRKVDMRKFNGIADIGGGPNGEGASRWRQLSFYRMRKEGPGDLDEINLNLHACAHMYASDRNSLFMGQKAFGYEKESTQMGSLAHTVVFHGGAEDMRMTDSRDNDKWFVQEAWLSASGENRLVHNSRLWDIQEGRVIAQTIQDGMMRVLPKESASNL